MLFKTNILNRKTKNNANLEKQKQKLSYIDSSNKPMIFIFYEEKFFFGLLVLGTYIIT